MSEKEYNQLSKEEQKAYWDKIAAILAIKRDKLYKSLASK